MKMKRLLLSVLVVGMGASNVMAWPSLKNPWVAGTSYGALFGAAAGVGLGLGSLTNRYMESGALRDFTTLACGIVPMVAGLIGSLRLYYKYSYSKCEPCNAYNETLAKSKPCNDCGKVPDNCPTCNIPGFKGCLQCKVNSESRWLIGVPVALAACVGTTIALSKGGDSLKTLLGK